MSSSTGIELGPDSCVLAGVRARRRGPDIFAAHVVEPSAWPGQDVTLSALLRSVRRKKKLPRTARVVAWGLPDGSRADDPVTRAALRPLVAAGFRIDAVLSPPQALALLAASRARRGDAAAVWLALNTSGAAIAIVRGTELLFSRAFEWSYSPSHPDPRAELLQRYSLVSHLAPEVQRGIAQVRASHGVEVETAITCGDLPDLRSLTMPLIEELDLEVETLDSIEGLRPSGGAKTERLAEIAPAIRLACAAAASKSQTRRAGPLVGMAVAAVLLAGVGWAGYTYWALSSPPRRPSAPSVAKPPVSAPMPTDRVETPAPQQAPRSSADTPRELPPGATSGSAAKAPPAVTPAPPAVAPAPPPVVAPVPSERVVRRPEEPPTLAPAARRAAPLKEALPVIDSILIDQNRRLAIIGGTIVAVGDRVGPRTVTQIERDFVILREPSGTFVRIPIGTKR